MVIRQQVKHALDEVANLGTQPRASKNGFGLVIKMPTGRTRALVDGSGKLTEIGYYYYDKIGIEPPNKFDFNQDAVRKGRSLYISMLDGTTRKVSTWNNIKNEFVMTKLGKQFYANAVDKYTVLFPVWVALTRVNGSIYRSQDWMPSSAIEDLG